MFLKEKNGLGNAASTEGDPKRACDFYSLAIKSDPSCADPQCFDAYLGRQAAYQELGRFADAKRDLETIIEKTGQFSMAIPSLLSEDEIHRLVCHVEAQIHLAGLYAGPLHNLQQAWKEYTKAIDATKELLPLFGELQLLTIGQLYYMRAEVSEGEGKYQQAREDWTMGIEKIKGVEKWNTDIENGILHRIRASHLLKKFRQAQEDCALLQEHNSFSSFVAKLGYIFSEVDPERALRYWGEAYEDLKENNSADKEALLHCVVQIWILNQSVRAWQNN